MARLALSLLGPFQVTLAGTPVTEFRSDKTRGLLAYLALEADRPHRRDALTGLLWPDAPDQAARNNLRQSLHRLRQAIGQTDERPTFLDVTSETVQFNSASDSWLDVTAFDGLMTAVERHAHRRIEVCPACIEKLRQAAQLYRGDFLHGFNLDDSVAFSEWAAFRREWLHRRALEALFHLAEHHRWRGEYEPASRYARRQLELEPWREEAYRQLMSILARRGERSAALAQYETCRRVLAEELGVEPSVETVALYERIRNLDPSRRHNLPTQSTPFIGRERELAEIAALLSDPDCRLLTLVGPGGIGKTRLALMAAEQQMDAFDDGVYFVPLAPLDHPDFMVSAIATTVGLTFNGSEEPRTQLLKYLRSKRLLLVMDNIEHLLSGLILVTALLQSAPSLILLVTSRERLRLHDEWTLDLSGLSLPGTGKEGSAQQYDAVRLFLESAHRVDTHFQATGADLLETVHICRMVEGMPLGIELAASWVRRLTCAQISGELRRGLNRLASLWRDAPERHRSLQDVVAHSWGLLSPDEQRVLRRLSVFRGGFEIEAAESVIEATLALLSELVDKSLLRRNANGRYEVHEIIRQFAEEQLHASGESVEIQDRHLAYFLQLAEAADQAVHTAEYPAWLVRLDTEIDNLRAALAWGQKTPRGLEAGLRLAGALPWYCYLANRWREGRDWAERMLTMSGSENHPIARARTLFTVGGLATLLDDYTAAEPYLEESIALFQQGNDLRGLAYALSVLGSVRLNQGDHATARALEEESVALFQSIQNKPGHLYALGALGDVLLYYGDYEPAKATFSTCLELSRDLDNPNGLSYALLNLGKIARCQGDYVTARALSEESLALAHEARIQRFQAMSLHNLGWVAQHQGRSLQAREHFVESMRLFQVLGDNMGMLECLEGLANHFSAQRQLVRAAHLFGAAEAIRETIKVPLPLGDRVIINESVSTLRTAFLNAIGEAGFVTAWTEGRTMTLEQAIEYAVSEESSWLSHSARFKRSVT
jgi:predicted ATPase/DNA-binding SARP family transcriptional activator